MISLSKSICLSSDDIREICENNVEIMTYDKIRNFRSLDSLIIKPVALLYRTSKNMGHWVCIFRNNRGYIEFFDSYGLPPDHELEFIDIEKRIEFGQEYPYLSELIRKSKCLVTYNKYQLQGLKDGVSTCGRWVAMRIALRNIPLNQFIKFFLDCGGNLDNLVTLATSFAK